MRAAEELIAAFMASGTKTMSAGERALMQAKSLRLQAALLESAAPLIDFAEEIVQAFKLHFQKQLLDVQPRDCEQ